MGLRRRYGLGSADQHRLDRHPDMRHANLRHRRLARRTGPDTQPAYQHPFAQMTDWFHTGPPDLRQRLVGLPTGEATVAHAFTEALREVNRFDRVVFAVSDGLPGTPVYAAFESMLTAGTGNVLGEREPRPDESWALESGE